MNKISKSSGLVAVILGATALLTGCSTERVQSPNVTPNAWDYAGLVGNLAGIQYGNKLNPKQAGALGALTQFSSKQGQAGRDIAVARASQPQININIPDYQQQRYGLQTQVQQAIPEDRSFTKYLLCNRWVDSNNNGKTEIEELIETKSRFRTDEEITAIAFYCNRRGIQGKKYQFKVYNSLEEPILENEPTTIPFDNCCQRTSIGNWILANAGTGRYKLRFFLDGECDGEADFEIYGELPPLIKKIREFQESQRTKKVESGSKDNAAEQLKRLKELKDDGAITEEEYQLKRKPYVDQL